MSGGDLCPIPSHFLNQNPNGTFNEMTDVFKFHLKCGEENSPFWEYEEENNFGWVMLERIIEVFKRLLKHVIKLQYLDHWTQQNNQLIPA